ncbi:MAG: ABC transporter substrate-binding protein [Anaerolineae bacterium]|nr:ABC transporter substrate-binding protein [Anaerolineae bacterium]MDW8101836.1 ABC transporter substrate-binding protein [Anaerolineae bacterium]
MRGKKIVFSLTLLFLLLVSCARPTPAPQKVTIAMGYIPNVQFAPFYVAVEKGYFREEGIELEFNYGWEVDLIKLVGTGELNFAVASGEQVLLARSHGLPVVYVAGWYHRFPVVVVSLEEKGFKSLQDLKGKRVGIPALFGASYIGWRALLKAEGLKEEEFNLQEIGYTQVESLTRDLVDAAICYAMNEPVQLRLAGYKVNIISVADRVNLISNGIMTNEKTIKENPRLVRGIVRAFLRGLRYTLEHPDEAFEISKKYVPEMKEEQKEVLKEAIKFWTSPHLGKTEKADWEATLTTLREMGLITREVNVEEAFTNEFVP